jgi:hypothetical protein
MASPAYGEKIPSGYKTGRIQKFTPEAMNLYKQMFSHVGPDSQLSKLASGDESTFQQMEAPALRQFNELQGNISSRFSGMGSGARRSSGFQNTMNQAGSNLAQDLQSQRQMLQRGALSELMGMSNQLLGQNPYENFMIEKQQRPSFGQQLMGGLAPLAGGAIGGMFGGPMGAAVGSQLGSALGSGFSGGQQQPMNFQGLSGLPTSWGSGNAPAPQVQYSSLAR